MQATSLHLQILLLAAHAFIAAEALRVGTSSELKGMAVSADSNEGVRVHKKNVERALDLHILEKLYLAGKRTSEDHNPLEAQTRCFFHWISKRD